jgi:hypothetical protein
MLLTFRHSVLFCFSMDLWLATAQAATRGMAGSRSQQEPQLTSSMVDERRGAMHAHDDTMVVKGSGVEPWRRCSGSQSAHRKGQPTSHVM